METNDKRAFAFAFGLVQIRKERGLSQGALGKLCGLSQQILSRLERSLQFPGLKQMLDISKALGVTTEEIIDAGMPRIERLERVVEEHEAAQKYPETPEHMDGPDNAPAGTYSAEGASTKTPIDNHGVVDILEPSLDQLLRWTEELLKGEEDAALAMALKTNIMQFHQSLLDRRQLKKTAPERGGPEDAAGGV